MTEKELNRLDWLRRQRTLLVEEKSLAVAKIRSCFATGVVMGSREEEPFNLHPVVVQGLSDSRKAREASAALEDIRGNLRKVEGQIQELEQFIRQVEDPVARDVMERHWIRGETWVGISTKMGKSENWARMIVNRYLQRECAKKK